MDEETDSKNASHVIRLLLKCGTFLQREGNRMVSEFGIKQQQFVVLNEIVRNGSVNQKKVVGELLFEKSNVSKIVTVLLKKELINVEPLETDHRVRVLTATPQWVAVWQQSMAKMDEWSESFTSPLTQGEMRSLIQTFGKLPMELNE